MSGKLPMVSRNQIPKLLESELEGFNAYVREHYIDCILEAMRIIKSADFLDSKGAFTTQEEQSAFAIAVFEKLSSPRVFLIEKWRDLSSEQRMKYYPDGEDLKLKAIKVSEMAARQMSK